MNQFISKSSAAFWYEYAHLFFRTTVPFEDTFKNLWTRGWLRTFDTKRGSIPRFRHCSFLWCCSAFTYLSSLIKFALIVWYRWWRNFTTRSASMSMSGCPVSPTNFCIQTNQNTKMVRWSNEVTLLSPFSLLLVGEWPDSMHMFLISTQWPQSGATTYRLRLAVTPIWKQF